MLFSIHSLILSLSEKGKSEVEMESEEADRK